MCNNRIYTEVFLTKRHWWSSHNHNAGQTHLFEVNRDNHAYLEEKIYRSSQHLVAKMLL